jgi:hypothetical protein
MEKKDVNKKEFPSFADLFGKKDVTVEGSVEEMDVDKLGFDISGDSLKNRKRKR